MNRASDRVAEWKRAGIGFAVVPALAPGDPPLLRVTAKQKPPPAVYEAIWKHKMQIIEVLQGQASVSVPVKVKSSAAVPSAEKAPVLSAGTGPALPPATLAEQPEPDALPVLPALAFPAGSGYAVGLVDDWKDSISDEEYRQIMRALPRLASRGALPLPTQSEEGAGAETASHLPLMKGQTVPDVNRFVLLTVERIRAMHRDLAEFVPDRTNGTFGPSGRRVLEGAYRRRVIEARELALFHLEAVAAWYFEARFDSFGV